MQIAIHDDVLDVSGVPLDTTWLLVLLNGVKCYEHELTTKTSTTSVPMREGFMASEMIRALPGCRGGSLQVYAVDDQQCVRGNACIPNFCHRNERRGEAEPDAGTRQRILASALRAVNETHRWEFPVSNGEGSCLLWLRLIFDVPPSETDAVCVNVRWSGP